MPALITLGKQKAILREGVWRSACSRTERMLNEATAKWIRETGGPKLFDKNPERTVARAIARQFGGRLALYLPSRRKSSQAVFLAHRQLELEF